MPLINNMGTLPFSCAFVGHIVDQIVAGFHRKRGDTTSRSSWTVLFSANSGSGARRAGRRKLRGRCSELFVQQLPNIGNGVNP
jgi:hypothetical protein